MKIKDKQDEEKNEIMEREEIIRQLKEANAELNSQVKVQRDIQSEIVCKMKEYKKDRDKEVGRLQQELHTAQEEIKIVVREYENKKKAAMKLLK